MCLLILVTLNLIKSSLSSATALFTSCFYLTWYELYDWYKNSLINKKKDRQKMRYSPKIIFQLSSILHVNWWISEILFQNCRWFNWIIAIQSPCSYSVRSKIDSVKSLCSASDRMNNNWYCNCFRQLDQSSRDGASQKTEHIKDGKEMERISHGKSGKAINDWTSPMTFAVCSNLRPIVTGIG